MSATPPDGPCDAWQPTFRWRPSQQRLLDECSHITDLQWHICAPPGSGKTLIGLELARRMNNRVLVLSPTTAIRDQWRTATALFGVDPATQTSTELNASDAMSSVTYQLIGNPGSAASELRAAARRLWVADLGQGDATAEARIDFLETHDPTQYRRELNRWVRTLRRTLVSGDSPLPPQHLLGDRSSALIDEIVEFGYGTIILDECHHLLDWWALVLSELIQRLRTSAPCAVIGLTATLPDPEGAREAMNYRRILGDVDVLIPMAALVTEGELAPWRDGVWFTTPTTRELAFLDDEQRHLEDDLDEFLRTDAFIEWAVESILAPTLEDRMAGEPEPRHWQRLWHRDPYSAQALTAWWTHRGISLPHGVRPLAPPTQFDARVRLQLLWQFVHSVRCPAELREPLTPVLARHGISLSAGGVGRTRSVADIVASRSDAKAVSAAQVIALEAGRRGTSMRCLVVLELDRADSPAATRDALDQSAGTALRALGSVCSNAAALDRGVIAVTGRGMWSDALSAERIAAHFNVDLGGERWLRVGGTDVRGVVELVGEGPGWSSAVRLHAARSLLNSGIVHTLLSTRALVGEGWNYPPLNVLIDLSEAASASSVTQLRGRAVRLDPRDQNKVASLWDVLICHDAAPSEWERGRRRHRHWWGPGEDGLIVTGASKASPLLGEPTPPAARRIDAANGEAWERMTDHEATRRAWAAHPDAANAVSLLDVRPVHRRSITARLPAGRRQRFARTWAIAATVGAASGIATIAVGATPATAIGTIAVCAGLGSVTGALAWRRSRIGVTTDDPRFWLAIGGAVRDGMACADVPSLGQAHITVEAVPGGHRLSIDAAPRESAAWCAAVREFVGPIGTPRWLIRTGTELWRVPGAVGATRAAADAFHQAVRATMPGAELIRGGTPQATTALAAMPARSPDHIDTIQSWR